LAGTPDVVAMIDSDMLSRAVAWILFGGVACLMIVFYLVNHKDVEIRAATWAVISNAVSLFCAILVFLAFREFLALITDGEDIQDRRLGTALDRRLAGASAGPWDQCWGASDSSGGRLLSESASHPGDDSHLMEGFWSHSHAADTLSRRLTPAPTQRSLSIDFFCFVFVFIALEAFLFRLRYRQGSLAAVGLISAHCMGFSALFAFGNMQQCEPFRNNAGLSFVVVLMALAVLLILCWAGHHVRAKVALWNDGHTDSYETRWFHQCLHTESEFVAFAVSFLLAQVIEFIAVGELAPLHAVPKGRDLDKSLGEFAFIIGLVILVIAAGYVEICVKEQEMGHVQLRIASSVEDTLAFTAGWCLVTFIKLAFWSATDDKGFLGQGNLMMSHVVIVLLSSVVTFAMVFVIDFVADRTTPHLAAGMRACGESFMLMLGIAWEGAFWEGAHAMSVGMGFKEKAPRMVVVILLSLSLVAIVMPAWIIYIVPHTLHAHSEHGEGHDEGSPRSGSPRHSGHSAPKAAHAEAEKGHGAANKVAPEPMAVEDFVEFVPVTPTTVGVTCSTPHSLS